MALAVSRNFDFIRMPFGLEALPDGWFTKAQINILYQYVAKSNGPILEIGPWIGRSTCTIAFAIKKSGREIKFDTVDFGISSLEEWQSLLGADLMEKPNADVYLKHILQPGGSLASLVRNLDERGVRDLVEIHKSDILDYSSDKAYELVFCDATHSVHEIERNIPHIVSMMVPNSTLICDDFYPAEFVPAILDAAEFETYYVSEGLFVGTLPDHTRAPRTIPNLDGSVCVAKIGPVRLGGSCCS